MTYFPGWMLESARYYLNAAELLDAQNLLHVAMVNAAIGMEILLKSFISVPDQHEGTSGETYKLDVEALKTAHQYLQSIGKIPPKQKRDAHDLLTLFHAMPAAIRESLALNSQEHSFERYRDVFTNSRYQYESASWKFADPVLMGCCGGRWPTWLVTTRNEARRIRSCCVTSLRSKLDLRPSNRGPWPGFKSAHPRPR
ncbi:hypothetical protein ACF8FB_17775 [Pseudomonas sp. yb_2]|uniref:hypothetical protein n=1 Tax=Pseudomonas sp. yb_2 TaxID=3367218 RepID=UPI00370CF4B7